MSYKIDLEYDIADLPIIHLKAERWTPSLYKQFIEDMDILKKKNPEGLLTIFNIKNTASKRLAKKCGFCFSHNAWDREYRIMSIWRLLPC